MKTQANLQLTLRPNLGMSLVEILTGLIIVAILGTAAFSSVRNYTIRSRVSEALILAEAVKPKLVQYVVRNRILPTSNSLWTATDYSSKYVTEVRFGKINDTAGYIEVFVNASAAGLPSADITAGKTRLFIGVKNVNQTLNFRCGPWNSSGTNSVREEFMPSACDTYVNDYITS